MTGEPAPRPGRRDAPSGTRGAPPPDQEPARRCELCGGPILERHCKVLCLTCGFQRDCSDP